MSTGTLVADAIVVDAIRPTIERISRQLKLKFYLDIKLILDKEAIWRQKMTSDRHNVDDISGEVRIAVSDTAINGRYKYKGQCLLVQDRRLKDFSGFQINGAVSLKRPDVKKGNWGFIYTYNVWEWGKGLADAMWEDKFQ